MARREAERRKEKRKETEPIVSLVGVGSQSTFDTLDQARPREPLFDFGPRAGLFYSALVAQPAHFGPFQFVSAQSGFTYGLNRETEERMGQD